MLLVALSVYVLFFNAPVEICFCGITRWGTADAEIKYPPTPPTPNPPGGIPGYQRFPLCWAWSRLIIALHAVLVLHVPRTSAYLVSAFPIHSTFLTNFVLIIHSVMWQWIRILLIVLVAIHVVSLWCDDVTLWLTGCKAFVDLSWTIRFRPDNIHNLRGWLGAKNQMSLRDMVSVTNPQ